jgi:hypothetical protein
MMLGMLLAIPAVALASDVNVAVVDITSPEGSVSLSPGGSGAITLNMSVTGNQAGTATFEVNQDWVLQSDGTFVGSNPKEFTVPPQSGGTTTNFSTTGTVSVPTGMAAGGPHTLSVGAFDITNSNSTGGKLQAGTSSSYQVTVLSDPCASVSAPAAPVITATPNTADGNGGWYKSIPTGVSATSATSGATITYATEVNGGDKSGYSSTAPTLGQGTTVVYAKATSATCNKVSESSRTFMVDSIDPVVEPESVVNNVWRNSDLSQTFTANDGSGSGLADAANDASFTLTASAESADADTPTVVSREVLDVAGNSTTRSVSAKIDLTDPSVNCGSADGAWHAGDVSIACTASDGLSDLADSNDASFNLSTSVANETETNNASTNSRNVLDNATNSTQAGPISGIKVDKKAPTFGACTGGPFTQGTGSQPVSITATDGGSEVNTAASTLSGQVDTNTIGAKTFTFEAKDNVGNTRTTSCSYDVDYKWDGFFQPVDNKDNSGNYILNKAKAGSVVPVKFSLGSDQGLNVLFSGFPQTASIPCTASSSDALEEYGTGNVSSFKYDPVANQYIYNWKTDPKWAGTCRQLVVKLADDTYHRANFNFFK